MLYKIHGTDSKHQIILENQVFPVKTCIVHITNERNKKWHLKMCLTINPISQWLEFDDEKIHEDYVKDTICLRSIIQRK